jgi:Apea-like HEPN
MSDSGSVIAPLLGTATDLTYDEPYSGVVVALVTEARRKLLLDEVETWPLAGYVNEEMLADTDLCLVTTVAGFEDDRLDDIHLFVQDFVRALRLLHRGDIGATVTFGFPAGVGSGTYAYGDFATAVRQPRARYALVKSDLPKVTSLLDLLRQDIVQESLAVSLRRFHQSYTRIDPEDQIIDLTIALESSLLYGLKDELSFRLGVRGAALLATTRDPQKAAQLLRVLYAVRSKVVHEGRTLSDLLESGDDAAKDFRKSVQQSGQPLDAIQLLEEFEEIVRQVLREYARRLNVVESTTREKPMAVVNRELDAKLLHALVPPESSEGE